MYVEAAIAEWIFQQEKSTLKNARKGYSNCGFALSTANLVFDIWIKFPPRRLITPM
jgi:hypothetical protein